MNKHDRPFRCDVAGCLNVNGFSTKGILQRHKMTHSQPVSSGDVTLSGNAPCFCPEPSCDRSSSATTKKPFTRKDNWDDHVKRKHKGIAMRHTTHPLGDHESLLDAEIPTAPEVEDLASPASQMQATALQAGKRKRVDSSASPAERASQSSCEHDNLQEENKRLKARVDNLERDLAASRKREETLIAIMARLANTS
jgi:hypothetical protein